MSATPYYYLLAQITLAVQTCETHPDAREALIKEGLGKEHIEQGRKLAHKGEELVVRRYAEAGEDRITEHALHAAVAELEMWFQTVRFRLRGAENEKAVASAVDKSLHAHDHTLTAIVRAQRLLSMIRAEEAVQKALPAGRSTHDLLIRGNTLMQKALNYTQMLLAPGSSVHEAAVFTEINAHRKEMAQWVISLHRAIAKLASRPHVVALLGYVPQGIGLPLGGASFAVPLHEEARREPPALVMTSTSGWSVGRQGRNRENLGKGFIDPTFE